MDQEEEVRDRIKDAANAVALPDGTPIFASVLDKAELPDEYPALVITLEDASLSDAQNAPAPATFSGAADVQGIIYLPTSTVDTNTEVETVYTTDDARRLFLALLHEMYNESFNPAQPPPALNITPQRVQIGQRTIKGQSMHAIGFAFSGPAQYTPQKLESFPAPTSN